MDEELDKKLCDTFPKLYSNRYKSMMETCMCWGFDCGEGWHKIIWDLSEKIEKIINSMPPDTEFLPAASQVKEKFGGLRFYMDFSTDEIEKEIKLAEKLSFETCETCGEKGNIRNKNHWYYTSCDNCDK